MHFETTPRNRLRLLYQTEKSEIHSLCGIIHQVLPWPTAGNTCTDRTHIRDSEHLAKLPKYRISLLLTASCPLAHISHSCHHTQTWPIPSSTPPIAMWFSPFPSFLWLFMVVCFEFFSLWFSWHIYSTLESRRSLPSGRRKESQRKAVSSMRENSGRLPSPSSVREDKGGKER